MKTENSLDFLAEFVKDCKRTDNSGSEEVLQRLLSDPRRYALITHMSLGLMTELGEIIDIFKRFLFYGEEFNINGFLEEVGDFEFYWQLLLDFVHQITKDERVNIEEILKLNTAKRAIRYPEGYTNVKVRDLEVEAKLFNS